jgi:hypothetical protein
LSFWYGLQFSEIAEMPIASINAYINKLEARKTEVKLMMADVVSLPKMKKNDRVSLVNSWMKLLNITSQAQAKPASPGRLKLMGIGVKHE